MINFFRKTAVLFIGLVLASWLPTTLAASKILIPAAPRVAASSYFLMDFNSGRVLVEKNADKKLPPASLTKIMTVYVVFRELSNGHLTLDEKVTISKKAWQTPGSRMFIEVNKQVAIKDLLKGVIIQSGNDASVALAEHVAGDESTFAALMNQHAQRLGMTNTHFENSMGLPHDNHYTTARDLAKLTQALIREFPDYYKWDAEKEFTYNNITQHNRNKLLWRDESVDGVKTGYTEEAGYCMVASARRNDMRLISVVMGTASENARANESQTLLNYGFRFFETHKLYDAMASLTEARVWKGDSKKLQLGLPNDLFVTIPRRHFNDLKAETQVDNRITAPVKEGEAVGTLNVTLAGDVIINKPLIALTTVAKGSLIQRLYDEALLLMEH
ncbi:D-alanyl-D-alanine carboxypeptidase family protein [Methylomarinum sp. Ch1-1]|uniref:serine-type D-Ala-D-Ala carboxypeptidase n=1 Tax=Methylomarinum roseum TaxID=3067653 RepID=A0AAU7NZY7_9GAMM|nr:D-alanyl-D-alanine carboxypeptidase family protein [Methylomarinum sp. Ch1-1]MDP4519024.1 D-alanyl-D-alanine carboxypeptidase family protein [Methylomarinum sp. Ch1-1]